MRVEHLFDIYAKLYMPTHHFEFYVSFFFYVLVTCSVLWCVVYVLFSCGNHIHERPCLSVRLSVCPSICSSLCEHVSSPITLVLYQMIRNTYCLWLPNVQGHIANFKVTQAKKKLSETSQIKGFRAFSGERTGEGSEISYADVSWPPNKILITVCWFY